VVTGTFFRRAIFRFFGAAVALSAGGFLAAGLRRTTLWPGDFFAGAFADFFAVEAGTSFLVARPFDLPADLGAAFFGAFFPVVAFFAAAFFFAGVFFAVFFFALFLRVAINSSW
jgi:hypothetical protein